MYMYKYIVVAKEWRDKVNGNSYFSAQIESTEDGSKTKLPFQYGYGDQYKYEAVRELVKEGLLEETKEYPFIRKIYLLNYQGRTGLGMGFASFVKSEVGQRITLKSGLAPIKIPTREIRIIKNNKK